MVRALLLSARPKDKHKIRTPLTNPQNGSGKVVIRYTKWSKNKQKPSEMYRRFNAYPLRQDHSRNIAAWDGPW